MAAAERLLKLHNFYSSDKLTPSCRRRLRIQTLCLHQSYRTQPCCSAAVLRLDGGAPAQFYGQASWGPSTARLYFWNLHYRSSRCSFLEVAASGSPRRCRSWRGRGRLSPPSSACTDPGLGPEPESDLWYISGIYPVISFSWCFWSSENLLKWFTDFRFIYICVWFYLMKNDVMG